MAPDKGGIQIFFLFMKTYVVELIRSASNEYPQDIFCGQIRKISIVSGLKKK